MSRSKKDGRHRGSHKLRKWRRLEFRRVEARSKIKVQTFDEYDKMLQDLDAEMRAEFLDDSAYDWMEHESYMDWVAPEVDNWTDEDAEYYSGSDYWDHYDYSAPVDEELYGYQEDPSVNVQLAVDRVVRRYGVEYTKHNAWVLATAFGVSTHIVERAISYTPAGYIRSAVR